MPNPDGTPTPEEEAAAQAAKIKAAKDAIAAAAAKDVDTTTGGGNANDFFSEEDPIGTRLPGNDVLGPMLDELAFGKDPKTSIESRSTLTPEQAALMEQQAMQGMTEEGLSLAGTEELRNQIAGGTATQTLEGIASRAGDPEGRTDYFKEASKSLTDVAGENMQTIGRDFGSSAGGMFSSERQSADAGVQKALADAQSKMMLDLIRGDEDMALKAATGLQTGEGMQLDAAKSTQQAELQRRELLNQLLGITGKENIVLNEGGTSGQAGGILGALMSDARLKYAIQPLYKMRNGMTFCSWRWITNGRKSFGLIAQDVQRVMPDAIVHVGKWLAVNYELIIQRLSENRTQGE